MTEEQLSEIEARLEKAAREVGDIGFAGRPRWRDSDIIIGGGLPGIPALIAEVRRLWAALEEIRGAALRRTVTKADDGTVLSTGVYCCECDAEAAGDAPLLHNTMTGDCGWVAPCGIAQAALAGTAQE